MVFGINCHYARLLTPMLDLFKTYYIAVRPDE